MATDPRTLAPNTSPHRAPAAAPPSPVSSKPLGGTKATGEISAREVRCRVICEGPAVVR